MYAIELQDLTKRYAIEKKAPFGDRLKQALKLRFPNYFTALRNVSFNVKAGEIFGLLGLNGAGKTTLIKIIAGLLKPDYGLALVSGYDVVKDRGKVRKNVTLLPSLEHARFSSKLTLEQNLRFFSIRSGLKASKQKIAEVLRTVDLEERKEYYPQHLSQDLRQKLNFAKCLLSDRALYLLDEPTANIDPKSANKLREQIRKLSSEGKTILLATSNLLECEELCHRVAVLNKGRIIALREAERIKKLGKDVFTLSLKKLAPELIKNLAELNFIDKVISEKDKLILYGDMRKQNLAVILELCREYGIQSVDLREITLNDLFLELLTEEEIALEVR